jgi:hypothetical protein
VQPKSDPDPQHPAERRPRSEAGLGPTEPGEQLVGLGIDAGIVTAYESSNKLQDLLTGRSAKVAGATYHDLDPECMAAIGAAPPCQSGGPRPSEHIEGSSVKRARRYCGNTMTACRSCDR